MAVKHYCDRCGLHIEVFSYFRNVPFIKPDDSFRVEISLKVQREDGEWVGAELCETCYDRLVLKSIEKP